MVDEILSELEQLGFWRVADSNKFVKCPEDKSYDYAVEQLSNGAWKIAREYRTREFNEEFHCYSSVITKVQILRVSVSPRNLLNIISSLN